MRPQAAKAVGLSMIVIFLSKDYVIHELFTVKEAEKQIDQPTA